MALEPAEFRMLKEACSQLAEEAEVARTPVLDHPIGHTLRAQALPAQQPAQALASISGVQPSK